MAAVGRSPITFFPQCISYMLHWRLNRLTCASCLVSVLKQTPKKMPRDLPWGYLSFCLSSSVFFNSIPFLFLRRRRTKLARNYTAAICHKKTTSNLAFLLFIFQLFMSQRYSSFPIVSVTITHWAHANFVFEKR